MEPKFLTCHRLRRGGPQVLIRELAHVLQDFDAQRDEELDDAAVVEPKLDVGDGHRAGVCGRHRQVVELEAVQHGGEASRSAEQRHVAVQVDGNLRVVNITEHRKRLQVLRRDLVDPTVNSVFMCNIKWKVEKEHFGHEDERFFDVGQDPHVVALVVTRRLLPIVGF